MSHHGAEDNPEPKRPPHCWHVTDESVIRCCFCGMTHDRRMVVKSGGVGAVATMTTHGKLWVPYWVEIDTPAYTAQVLASPGELFRGFSLSADGRRVLSHPGRCPMRSPLTGVGEGVGQ